MLYGVYIEKVRENECIGSTGTSFKIRWQQHKHSILKKAQHKQPTQPNSQHQTTSTSLKSNGQYYLKPTAWLRETRIVAPSATWKEWLSRKQIEIRHLMLEKSQPLQAPTTDQVTFYLFVVISVFCIYSFVLFNLQII